MIYLTQKQISKTILVALLLLAGITPSSRADNNTIPWKTLLAATPFVYSLYVYFDALPHTNANRYSKERLKQKINALKKMYNHGNFEAIKKATKEVITELNYFLEDWLIGHPSAVHGPERNEETGQVEMVAIPSRGVYGYIDSKYGALFKGVVITYFVGKTIESRGNNIKALARAAAGLAEEAATDGKACSH